MAFSYSFPIAPVLDHPQPNQPVRFVDDMVPLQLAVTTALIMIINLWRTFILLSQQWRYQTKISLLDRSGTHIQNALQLHSSEPYIRNDQAIVGNGDFLPITHVGSIALTTPQRYSPSYEFIGLSCYHSISFIGFIIIISDFPCELISDVVSVCVKENLKIS